MTDEERSKFYTIVQNFLKTSPLGIFYSGPINGELNSSMLSSLQNLENILSSRTDENFNGSVVKGTSISSSGFQKMLQKCRSFRDQKATSQKDEKKQEEKKDSLSGLTLEFQKFFSLNHDFFPKLYSGSLDGKINSELVSAAKKAEDILSQEINEPKIKGQIFSDKKQQFLTSPIDILSAINLISKNKNISTNIKSSN
jgi:hypothetical protein